MDDVGAAVGAQVDVPFIVRVKGKVGVAHSSSLGNSRRLSRRSVVKAKLHVHSVIQPVLSRALAAANTACSRIASLPRGCPAWTA